MTDTSDESVRILTIGPFPPTRDGIGQHAADILSSAPAGLDRHVLTPSTEASTVLREGVSVHGLTAKGALRGEALKTIRSSRPDIIHVHFCVSLLGLRYTIALLSALWVRGRDVIPVVVTNHEVVRDVAKLGGLAKAMNRFLAKAIDVTVVYSKEAKDILVKGCDVSPESVVVVPLGMPARPNAPCKALKSPPQFLTFGFMHPDKGTHILLEAVRLLLEDGTCPPFQVLLSGQVRKRTGVFRLFESGDRRYQRRIDTQIKNGLSAVVSRRYFLSDLELDTCLAESLAFVAPYLKTTQSAAVNRAAGAGIPIVASDLEGLRAGLEDAGLWVRPGDPKALAQNLRRLLEETDLDGRLRDAIQSKRKTLSMDSTARQQAELWRSLLVRRLS